jgi:uracil-DNA glycosylase
VARHERELIKPPVTVALGATAARSLIGKAVTIKKVRGIPDRACRRVRMLGHRSPERAFADA